jgi:hypothetical protein
MQDLEMAKERLHEGGLGLSIVKDGCVLYESTRHGIYDFLNAVEKEGAMLLGAAVADRVVGKAIALLCIYAKVEAVYAMILSVEARATLEQHSVHHEWEALVENVLNIDQTGTCPFERVVMRISNPTVAFKRLRALCDGSKR